MKYKGRSIHDAKLLTSLTSGNLDQMLSEIRKDNDLDVQIRNDYLNIYYNGGSIAKVSSEKSVKFDMFYYYLNMKKISKKAISSNKKVLAVLKLKRDNLHTKFRSGNYMDYFRDAKKAMDKWLLINPKPERMEQHQMAVENRYGKSDYTIIDLEYQVSIKSKFACTYDPKGKGKPKKPRFDIIAVDKSGRLCVIELKKGLGALNGTSGLKEHWHCYQESIGRNPQPFVDEMKNLLKQKQALKLIDSRLAIKMPDPVFMFAYAYDKKHSTKAQKAGFLAECRKTGLSSKPIIIPVGTYKL